MCCCETLTSSVASTWWPIPPPLPSPPSLLPLLPEMLFGDDESSKHVPFKWLDVIIDIDIFATYSQSAFSFQFPFEYCLSDYLNSRGNTTKNGCSSVEFFLFLSLLFVSHRGRRVTMTASATAPRDTRTRRKLSLPGPILCFILIRVPLPHNTTSLLLKHYFTRLTSYHFDYYTIL